MLARLVCALLIFYVREFPEKPKTWEPREIIVECTSYGLQINPYGPYLANNMVSNKQMEVVWHVDDLKVSHINRFEITKFAGYGSIIYGKLTVHSKKVYDYLGIYIDYSEQGTVNLFVIKYLDIVVQYLPDHWEWQWPPWNLITF